VTPALPRVALVGGSDVDSRLDLMRCLRDEFDLVALGASPTLAERFSAEGFGYGTYHLAEQGRVSPVADVRTVAGLVREFRRWRPQIVHAFDTKPGVWGCLAARMAGVPVAIGTITGFSFLYGSPHLKTRLAWFAYQRLQALACRFSDATVFQNHEDARHFIADGIVKTEKTKIILGSGVSTDVFSPECVSAEERHRIREELGLSAGETVVTMISRVIRSKGVLEFAAAARSIRADRPGVRFLLIGPLPRDSMDRLSDAEVRQLREAVTWPGARRDVLAVLAVSDIVTLPTAYREGLPRVLLEAGSMGLPIVTTDSPGCNEVVEDGFNGFLTPASDSAALARAILRLIDDPELRFQFGKRSRERVVERFDLSVIAGQTREMYHQLLERKVRR
jgi:glycosyltransferase involved in cell wall biosynthesis